MKIQHFLPALALILSCSLLRADVTPNALFSDNAVMQQGVKVPVWGTAAEGEKVTVQFAGQKAEAVAKDGKWMVRLEPLMASFQPQSMTITGSNSVTLTNLLIGEVWLCSGQSNMERQLGLRSGQKPLVNWEAEAATANYPEIREFDVKKTIATNPLTTLSGTWAVCSPQTVTNFSAVGYYFGRDLSKDLKVPVGLIHSSWGGTPAESWTRQEALVTNPALTPILLRYTNDIATYAERLAKYQADEPKLKAEYTNACAQALAEAKPTPRPPAPPKDPINSQNSPSMLFNGMINPLLPYAIKGAIWYQGESNGNRAKEYQILFPAMIADWRAQWGDIHPTEKEPVGARLELAARALGYGEKAEFSGPLYSSSKIEGNKINLSFTHTGRGLVSKDGPLKGFTIAGADKKFVPAQAEITGETIIVLSPEVDVPVAVRYGWTNVPDVNLFNADGLPASPFRTDLK